ncbi:hypothetical protein [Clostridium chrysemydis]|uniref:hypothetical protein n=1 Tax=Clostridium chrysemydis TaxID=2665504 RepID=UPI001884623A|nr:hypothetical protein [Clostridium chrysemydis]
MTNETVTKVSSDIKETTNLSGVINVEANGMNQQVMTIQCNLGENSVANIQTYVTNQELFLANSQQVSEEVQKFRTKAVEVAKGLNCFVF